VIVSIGSRKLHKIKKRRNCREIASSSNYLADPHPNPSPRAGEGLRGWFGAPSPKKGEGARG